MDSAGVVGVAAVGSAAAAVGAAAAAAAAAVGAEAVPVDVVEGGEIVEEAAAVAAAIAVTVGDCSPLAASALLADSGSLWEMCTRANGVKAMRRVRRPNGMSKSGATLRASAGGVPELARRTWGWCPQDGLRQRSFPGVVVARPGPSKE